jgi:hypothetical protein
MSFFIKAFHLIALGLWLGSVTFFSFFTALPIINKYRELAKQSGNWLGFTNESQGTRAAGEALEVVFTSYFPFQVACGMVALLTAFSWWNVPGVLSKLRVVLVALALGLSALNLLVLAPRVSELRNERYAADPQAAATAEAKFGPAHTYSLLTDMATLLLVIAAMVLAAGLPSNSRPE